MEVLSSKNRPLSTLATEQSDNKDRTAKTTTRVELLDAVYNACPSLSRAQARDIFEMTLDEIVDALIAGEAVKLRAFGAFNVRSKRERIGRNPRNGVEATIHARRVLTFKPSPTLIALVNGLNAPDEELENKAAS